MITALLLLALAQASPWQPQTSGTTAGLRGLHAVNSAVVWASGTDGTILRSLNGGALWQPCTVPPNAARLDVRAVWAWDERRALVLSSGPGDLSRLYATSDGCKTWHLLYTNPDTPNGFWDGLVFLNPRDGFIYGDPIPDPRVKMLKPCPVAHARWRQNLEPGGPQPAPPAGRIVLCGQQLCHDAKPGQDLDGHQQSEGVSK